MLTKAKYYSAIVAGLLTLSFVQGCQDGTSRGAAGDQGAAFEFYSIPYVRAADGSYSFKGSETPLLGSNDSVWAVTWNVTPKGGGTLSLLNSSLYVPPGAVTSSTRLTWVMSTGVPRGLPNPLSRLYEFGPDGTEFESPVTLRVAFADAGLWSQDPHDFSFFYHNPEQNSWDRINTIVDVSQQRFVVELDHFSQYAFGRNQ